MVGGQGPLSLALHTAVPLGLAEGRGPRLDGFLGQEPLLHSGESRSCSCDARSIVKCRWGGEAFGGRFAAGFGVSKLLEVFAQVSRATVRHLVPWVVTPSYLGLRSARQTQHPAISEAHCWTWRLPMGTRSLRPLTAQTSAVSSWGLTRIHHTLTRSGLNFESLSRYPYESRESPTTKVLPLHPSSISSSRCEAAHSPGARG